VAIFVNMKEFLPSELVINENGAIYHLGIRPEEIAEKIILVGDQDRVALISNQFENVTHKSRHREFVCHTGQYNGKEISVISTGIGTDNIDIVLNELDALVNIDFTTRKVKSELKKLEIVRIGTCGILQDDIPLDSFILSSHSMGIDNIGHFYQREQNDQTAALLNKIENQVDFPSGVEPYLTAASNVLNDRLRGEMVSEGITITSSGFYGPQGRQLRLGLTKPNLVDQLSAFVDKEYRFYNMEMETSALFALSKAFGHDATALCLGIANRRNRVFSTNYNTKILELIRYVLERI
jgi:uridine phosphorylase